MEDNGAAKIRFLSIIKILTVGGIQKKGIFAADKICKTKSKKQENEKMAHLYIIFNVIISYLRNLFQKMEFGLRSDIRYIQPTCYTHIRFSQALRLVTFAVLLVLSAGVARGQACDGPASTVVNTIKPMTVCSGGELRFSVGYDSEHDSIVLTPAGGGEPSATTPDTMFIPQGGSGYNCDGNSCAIFSSPITISGYNNQTISDSNDIKYVRLNIEHGLASELNIRLVCPNGTTRVHILNAFFPDNDCGDPYFNYGWHCDNCASEYEAFFGEGDYVSSDSVPCDPSNPYNVPQAGRDYCWSNNSIYQYAGLIY